MTVSASKDSPTPELRWLDVGGCGNILQQKWEIQVYNESTKAQGMSYEWRTVPIAKDERRKK